MCPTGFICAFCDKYAPLWHVEHWLLVPVWFIVAGANATVFGWQVSQAVPVGMCVAGLAHALAAVYAPLWQLKHCPAVPVWSINAGLNATKFLWQVSHCNVGGIVGIWLVGLDSPVPPGLWQVEHKPAVGTLE